MTMSVLQELDAMLNQVSIDLRIMDHFAQQENPFPGIFLHGTESDINGVFHPVAKAKMPGQADLYRAKVQQGGAEILFHFVGFFPLFFNGRNQRTAVKIRDIELLHAVKLMIDKRM